MDDDDEENTESAPAETTQADEKPSKNAMAHQLLLQTEEPGHGNDDNDAVLSDSGESNNEAEDQEEEVTPKVPNLEGLTKAERKRVVKEFNRKRRLTKTPKHVKKRNDKLAKQRRGKK